MNYNDDNQVNSGLPGNGFQNYKNVLGLNSKPFFGAPCQDVLFFLVA